MPDILLLVEGEIFTQGLRLYLEQWGFSVQVLQRCQFSFAELIAMAPALVVLDLPVTIARSNVTGDLLSKNHSIPLLLLVTDARLLQQHSLRLQQLTHYDCLPKPCPIAQLKRAVKGLIGSQFPIGDGTEAVVERTIPPSGWGKDGISQAEPG